MVSWWSPSAQLYQNQLLQVKLLYNRKQLFVFASWPSSRDTLWLTSLNVHSSSISTQETFRSILQTRIKPLSRTIDRRSFLIWEKVGYVLLLYSWKHTDFTHWGIFFPEGPRKICCFSHNPTVRSLLVTRNFSTKYTCYVFNYLWKKCIFIEIRYYLRTNIAIWVAIKVILDLGFWGFLTFQIWNSMV